MRCFCKGKYKNKDKVSELTPLSFLSLLFRVAVCFPRELLMKVAERISRGSTKQGKKTKGQKNYRKCFICHFPLSFITIFMSQSGCDYYVLTM